MENLRSKKALSPVVAAIILIVVTVIVSIAVAAMMGALTFTYMKADLDIRVNAKIYSANDNLGVLNEDGEFDIFIENYIDSNRTISIVVEADEQVLFNETVPIEARSSKNLTINQQLICLGLWAIKLYEDREISDKQQFSTGKEIVGCYSFVTVVNKAEADMKITQLDNIRLNRTLSIVAIITSIPGVIVSIVSVGHTIKQYMRDKKEEDSARA